MAASRKSGSRSASAKGAPRKGAGATRAATKRATAKRIGAKGATAKTATKRGAATKRAAAKRAASKPATAKRTSPERGATKRTSPKRAPAAPAVAPITAANAHGVALVDAVIARVKSGGGLAKVLGDCRANLAPRPVPPDALAALRFPNGADLSPALRRWLAFDAAWLGWFADPRAPVFAPQKLGEYALAEYGMDWGYGDVAKKLLRGDCFPLRFGADSRRFLYVGEPDSTGEHPVLLLDTDDVPYVGVEYPGLDVYLALHAGLLGDDDGGTYGWLASHRWYKARMAEHAARNLAGMKYFELGNDLSFEPDGTPFRYVFLAKGAPRPPGVVTQKNDFGGEYYIQRIESP